MAHWIGRGLLALLAGFGVGCSGSGGGANAGKLRVVVTTGMIADAVRRVGGDHVAVEALMGPGVDPHKYTPSAGDLSRLAAADLVFFNGLHLEGKMTDILESPGRGKAKAVPVTRAIPPDRLRPAEFAEGSHDPHVWFDVELWMSCVAVVRDELAHADPAHADTYRTNADRHLRELAALDAEVDEKARSLPKERRVLVTSHDAFGYFGAAYGFEVRGLQGVSTAAETPLSEVQALARFLGGRKIPAVFGETSVPPKGLQKVLDAVRSEYNHEVRLVGGDDALYSDALGEPGTPGETYSGMVRHNVGVIVSALGK